MLSHSKFNGYSADGRRIYYFGGGGGKAPKNTTQTVIQDVAPWAREAAKETLAKGMELTNQGYEQYGGDRLAGFSPLQQQSFEGASGLGYTPAGQQYTGANVGQYMNPYLQNVLAPQLREAATTGLMAQNMDAAKAVGRGAFGGTRSALQQSLTQKNVLQNMADINARGYGAAFDQAAGMFNTDQARRIQEAQFGSQFGMDVNKLQNQYGQQQQAQQQRGLDVGYQNWMNQKNFDWDQIMRRSDLLRAVPSGSSSTTSMYRAGPSTAQNLAAAGSAAYGASQLFARGGLTYAVGGITGDENVAAIVPTLSNAQLKQAYDVAVAIGDPERIRVISEELQKRGVDVSGEGGTGQANLPSGSFAAMPQPEGPPVEQPIPTNSISAMANPEMVDNIMPTQQSMANGGIVAFSGEDESLVQGQGQGSYTPGNEEIYNAAGQEGLDAIRRKKELKPPVAMTPAQYRAAILSEYNTFKELAGDDPYGPMEERLKARETKLSEREKQSKGLAALAAVPELLQGSNFAEAAGRGIGAAAKSYQGSMAETDRQRNAIEEYQFLMADAKRKERMGDLKGARESVKAAEAARLAVYNAERTALQGDITGAAALATPFKPTRPTGGAGGAGGKEKLPEMLARVKYEDLKRMNDSLPKDQQKPDTELRRLATEAAMKEFKTTDIGVSRTAVELKKLDATITASEEAQIKSKKIFDPAWQRAAAEQDIEGMIAAERAILDAIREQSRSAQPGNPKPVNPNSGKSGTVPTTAPPGSTLGKMTSQGREVLDSSGKLIGHVKG
jgi:hypothetical protein